MRAMNDLAEPVTAPQNLSRAEHAAGMGAYRAAGERLAAEIGNRGPLRLTDDGALHPISRRPIGGTATTSSRA